MYINIHNSGVSMLPHIQIILPLCYHCYPMAFFSALHKYVYFLVYVYVYHSGGVLVIVPFCNESNIIRFVPSKKIQKLGQIFCACVKKACKRLILSCIQI